MFNKYRNMDMLHGSLWDKLAAFALPLALTSVLQQFYNAADVMVLGRFAGDADMAAVGNSIPVVALIVNLFVGLSLGANVVMARFIGAGRPQEAVRAMHTALWIAMASGLGVAIAGLALTHSVISWMGVPEEIRAPAAVYLRWYFLAMPLISLFNFEAAFFRSVGDTGTPLIALLISCSFNIAGNLIAVTVFDSGISGVACVTLLAFGVSSAFLWWRLRRAQGLLHLSYSNLRIFEIRKARAIVSIGMPAGVQGMVFAFSNLIIQAAINSLGPEAMAATAAAFTIENNAFCFINAFGQAATTFTGQNCGAGDLKRCKKIFWECLLWDEAVCAVLAVSVYLASPWLLGLFTDSEEVVEIGMLRIIWVLLPQGINAFLEVFSGAMRGYGYSLPPALTVLFCVCGERLLWVWFAFPQKPDYETLMVTYPLSWLITVPSLAFLYIRCLRYFAPKAAGLTSRA